MGYLDNTGLSYLWGKIKTALSGYLPLTGATLTKPMTLLQGSSEATVSFSSIDRKYYTSIRPGGITTNQVNIKSSPLNPTDCANKQYVDDVVAAALASAAGVPSGTIVMWSGSVDSIPAGWALCNGENGTPDLRGRFILGAGGAYSVGATGGEEEVTLTIEQMPEHKHELITKYGTGYEAWQCVDIQYSDVAGPDHEFVLSAGGSKPHNNMPPYYALCYIMKL